MSDSVSAEQLITALRSGLGEGVEILSREPYRYATSSPLEHVRVRTPDGSETDLILKELARERLMRDALASKPAHVFDSRRELEVYRRVLAPAAIGARCAAASGGSRPWLLIEKVPGVELWQVGEVGVWEQVATWLGELHDRFAGREQDLREAAPSLLELDRKWLILWVERARAALRRSPDERAGALLEALAGYEACAADLSQLPRTLVHGELYPSNVVVDRDRDPVRVCPVDWEMAGVGPGVLDVAALVGGWDAAERQRLVAAYRAAATRSQHENATGFDEHLALARLHYALQWLGWSTDWRPPPEHSHDWVGEALALARKLELS